MPIMLHAGAELATLEDLRSVETPKPSGRHYPIPHAYLRDLVVDTLHDRGLAIESERIGLTETGDRYFGLITLERPEDEGMPFAPTIGLRSSHDKSFAASVVLGSRVFVCDNLAFSGEVKVSRKNTRFGMRDIPGRVETGVSQVLGSVDRMQARYQGYMQQTINQRQTNQLVMQLLREHAIPASKIPEIVQETEEPTHVEHLNRYGMPTLWTLFNGVTEVLRGSNAETMVGRTIKLHRVIDAEYERATA